MPGGRPPKPTELKRKLGNPGKRRLAAPPGVPLEGPQGAAPAPPTGLKRHGKAAWNAFWALGEHWLNPTTDLAILTRLCQAYDEREELRKLVALLGHLVWEEVREEETPDDDAEGEETDLEAEANGLVPFPGRRTDELLEGQPHGGALKRRKRRKRLTRVYSIKANPAVQQLRKLEELITRWEGLCGFTPSDRTRLGLAVMKARSALDDFLAGGD